MKLHRLLSAQKNRIWSMLYLGATSLLFLAGFGGNAKTSWAQSAPTIINIGTTVQQTNVRRLGINIGGQTFYDSGQMLRDITFNNPGFEAQQWQSVLICTAVSGNTCTDGNGWSQWPANFLQGGNFTFIWGAAKGKTGSLVSMTKASGNGGAPYAWYDFGSSVTPAVGDTFIINKTMPGIQTAPQGQIQAGWWPSLSGGATITADTTDLSPDTPGIQAIELKATASGSSASESSYFDETTRSFLQMNGTYTVTFRAKGKGGSNQVNVSVGRYNTSHGNMSYLNKTITLTDSWANYSYTFNATEDGTYIGTGYLTFNVNSSDVLLDDASLTESATGSNTTPFRDAVVQRLQELNPGVLRYMDSGTDFGTSIDNMIAVPQARLRTGYSPGSSAVSQIPLGLEEFLQLCQAVGAEPWYTMPMGTTPTEAQHLIEFLGGSSSTPYGAKRAALGQTAAWTSVFPIIHLELGDESWNYAFTGDTIGSPFAYGNRAGAVFGAAKASASYTASKFDLILNGFASSPWWGEQAMNNASNNYDTVDAAPYTFNSFDSYASNEDVFGSLLAEGEMIDSRPTGLMYQQMQTMSGNAGGLTGKPANLAIYEVNLSTVSGSAPQSMVNSTVPSLGAGLSVAEHMLLMLRDDNVNLQTLFALPEYTNGYNGSGTTQLWGSVIDMGGQTNLCRPQFLAEELANTAVGGTMLVAAQSGGNPTWNEISPNDSQNPINITGAHYIQSFAFVNGTENSLILFNLSRTASLPVTFTGVNAPSGTVQVGLLTSANITDTNEATGKVAIANSTLANFNPSATTNLPPYSMTVYQWSTSGGIKPIQPVETTTRLTATPTSSTLGATIVLAASVTGANSSIPSSGNVVFSNGGTTLATSAISAGKVSLDVSTLTTGTHTLTATYLGTSSFTGSASAPVTVTISAAPLVTTKTTLTAPATVTDGQSATLTATVTPSSGSAAGGTVTFLSGTTTLGTASLASGKATYTLSDVTLAPGTYELTAVYGGNSLDGTSTSSQVALKVSGAVSATTTALVSPPTKVTEGKNVTITATVKAAEGVTPTGTVNFYVGTGIVGSAQLSGGTATFTIMNTLTPGTYEAFAGYAGDSTDSASMSAEAKFTVVAATVATVTDLTTSTTQTAEGNPVVLTAAVVPQTPGDTATGAVTFYLGQTTLGTGQLAGGQVALNITTQFAPGTYQLTAFYAGDGTDLSSSSAPVTLTITPDAVATSIQLTASPTSLTSGQSTVLTSTVTAAAGGSVPTGVVTFYLGQTQIGSAKLTGATAQVSYTATMPAGTYQVTAAYAGTSLDNASTSAPVTITIAPSVVSTTTLLAASATSITQGQPLALTSTVAPATGTTTPQGTVSFYLGATQIGSATLTSGVATISDTNLAPGTYQLTAVYAGNAQDSASTSNAVTVKVVPAVIATTTVLSASASQVDVGKSFSLTATVAPSTGTTAPQGVVTFFLGQTQLGTVSLVNGIATMSESNLAAGSYTLTAIYTGNAQDSTSTSNPITVTVAVPTATLTSTALTASAAQLTAGQPFTLNATVSSAKGTAPPQGTVSFYLGQTQIGSATLASGSASMTDNSNLAAGTYQLTAVYAGNTQDSASTSNTVTIKIASSAVATTTVLTASAAQVTVGKSFSLTAIVAPASGTTAPQGTVTFYLGQTQIGSATLVNGTATMTESNLSAGSYSLTAVYAGNTQDSTSTSNPVSVNIADAAAIITSTSLTSSASQLSPGQSFSLTATVSSAKGTPPAQGTISFYLGTTQIGSATLTSGTATITDSATGASTLAPGSYQLTAVYAGNTQDSASTSNPISLTIADAAAIITSTSLTASAAQLNPGQPFTLTATVTSAQGTPPVQGTVSFYLGATQIGSATLASGTASMTDSMTDASTLAPGTYQLTAVYAGNTAGNTKDAASTSTPITLTVVAAALPPPPAAIATTTTLSASTPQVTTGQPFTLSAIVAPATGSASLTGTVNFFLGQTQIGSVALVNNTATLSPSDDITPGTYQLTAIYAGNAQDNASTSSPVTLVVNGLVAPQQQPLSTTTVVTVDPVEPVTGQPMQLQVQVAAIGTAVPVSGTVTLYMGQTSIGTATLSAGSSSVSMPAPQPGTYTATAVFAAQGDYLASQSQPVTFTVQSGAAIAPTQPPPTPGTFTLGLSTTSLTLPKAQTASLQVMVASVHGYTGTVDLSCSGLPSNVACNFAPADLSVNAAGATSTLSLSALQNTAYSSPMLTNVAHGILLPWDIIGVLGFISGRKRLRGRWSAFMTLCLALLCCTIWMTGCGLTVNTINQPYQVTVTAVGANQATQTSTFTLYINQPAAIF